MNEVRENAGVLIEYWHQEGMDIFDDTLEDKGIRYYCAGYVSRALIRKESCHDCKNMLVTDITTPSIQFIAENEIDEEMKSKKEAFLKSINRGGLCTPSDLVYLSCTYVFNFYDKIFKNTTLKPLILNFPQPRDAFVESFFLLISENACMSDSIMKTKCKSGHEFEPMLKDLVKRVFNICSKNVIAEANSTIHEGRKRKTGNKNCGLSKKIAKLQS